MKKINLNLGSGIWIRKGFINVDKFIDIEKLKKHEGRYKHAIFEKGAQFVKSDILHLPFKDNFADYVEMMQVIEHFPMYSMISYLKEVRRVMKPGAQLIMTCPNFDGLAIDWLQMSTNPPFDPLTYYDIAETLYGNQRGEGENHTCPITQPFLNYALIGAGFKKGVIVILRKGSKTTKIGTVRPMHKDSVLRNDQLYAECYK